MDRIHGTTLQEAWADLSPGDVERICQQLAAMIHEIRSCKSPYGPMICSASGGPFTDSYLRLFGRNPPFADEQHLNNYILEGNAAWPDDILSSHSIPHPIVFTHGELARRNIMVHHGNVTAIIDWETAGWRPAHWEYFKAMITEHRPGDEWLRCVAKFTPVYEREYDALLHWTKFRGSMWVR